MHGSAPWKTEETIVGLTRLLVLSVFSRSDSPDLVAVTFERWCPRNSGKTGDISDVLIVPKGMGHMDWVRDSLHQSRIVPPRRDLRRLASVQAVTRLSCLYLPGGTVPFFSPLHQAFTCMSPRLLPPANGRYQ